MEIIKLFLNKYGILGLVCVIGFSILIWFIADRNAQSGKTVSVLWGLVEYSKPISEDKNTSKNQQLLIKENESLKDQIKELKVELAKLQAVFDQNIVLSDLSDDRVITFNKLIIADVGVYSKGIILSAKNNLGKVYSYYIDQEYNGIDKMFADLLTAISLSKQINFTVRLNTLKIIGLDICSTFASYEHPKNDNSNRSYLENGSINSIFATDCKILKTSEVNEVYSIVYQIPLRGQTPLPSCSECSTRSRLQAGQGVLLSTFRLYFRCDGNLGLVLFALHRSFLSTTAYRATHHCKYQLRHLFVLIHPLPDSDTS